MLEFYYDCVVELIKHLEFIYIDEVNKFINNLKNNTINDVSYNYKTSYLSFKDIVI